MKQRRVGVIRGGKTNYEASLKEGSELLSHLLIFLAEKWKPVDVFIDRGDNWHAGGIPVIPENLSSKADIFWDTTQADAYLALKNVPLANISGGTVSLGIEGRKRIGEHFGKIGIKTLRHLVFPAYQEDLDGPLEKYARQKALEVFEKFSPPWEVRLFPGHSKEGSRLVKDFPTLIEIFFEGAKLKRSILVEEFISPEKSFIHSLLGFREKEIYVFPLIEEKKETKEKVEKLAEDLHKVIPGAYYLNTQFVSHPKRGIFLQNFQLAPDLEKNSSFLKTCQMVGIKSGQVLDHILEQAWQKTGL